MDATNQRVEFSQFVVRPLAKKQRSERDKFGNHVNYFEIVRGLKSFSLSAIHTVTTLPKAAIDLEASSPWERVAGIAAEEIQLARQYLNDSNSSSYVEFNQALTVYANRSFVPGRPILDAAFHLMRRIYDDFRYDTTATKVDTTAIDAFELKRGVCQDFTHIAIACLNSLGLPARYVSGYVDTQTASLKPVRKTTADVSHAWFSVYDPRYAWVDFDAANNKMPDESYITVAYGHDYNDIAPLKGQVDVYGQSKLKVNVDMIALNR